MQVDFRLQSYLSSATRLSKFLQVCSEVLISLARCISREESIRNSREHNTTSSLLQLSLPLLRAVLMVMDVEKKITRSNRIFYTILRKTGGKKEEVKFNE
jgi:hypothetical protein